MTSTYTYSLVPIMSVSLLLFSSLLLYGGGRRSSAEPPTVGLTLYCAAIALWSTVLFLFSLSHIGNFVQHFVQVGAFVTASFMHAAYDFTRQPKYGLVWLAYATAALIVAAGVVWPGLLYSPVTLKAGPAFWPSMAAAVGAVALPLWHLVRAYRAASVPEKRQLRTLAISGGFAFLGGWLNVLWFSYADPTALPMFMVLGSLLLLTGLVRHTQREAGRKLLERSLLYAALTALLSAGFLFVVIMALQTSGESALQGHWLRIAFFLFMAALAFEPLRQSVQRVCARFLLKQHAGATDLAHALAEQEVRADHAQRLAELGQFVSAVAHEVRNPLGVITAHLCMLENAPADEAARTAIAEQVARASKFVDDLLRYGRPRPLELRLIDLVATIHLAQSTALLGGGNDKDIAWDGLDSATQILIEGDQAQLGQVFTILFENAILALDSVEHPVCRVRVAKIDAQVHIAIEDSGPGIPTPIRERIFQPFVTGRKRDGTKSGTGLGLAIARSIVERHHGTISASVSELGGARFEIALPGAQTLLTKERSSS